MFEPLVSKTGSVSSGVCRNGQRADSFCCSKPPTEPIILPQKNIMEVRDFPTVRGISPGGELQGEAQREKREVNIRREVRGTGARWCF